MDRSSGKGALVSSRPEDEAMPLEEGVKPRTPAQLALLQAAMMEELGIGRKDALPLEDRGYNDASLDLKYLCQTTKRSNSNDPVARWQNYQFDDVDPAMDALDPIASGQLYRMRRIAASRGAIQQSPARASKGRGLLSYRRGYSGSGTGRGTNISAISSNHKSHLTSNHTHNRPATSSSGGRFASHQTRIDMTIARLRTDSLTYQRSSKPTDLHRLEQNNTAKRRAGRPASSAQDIHLASPEAFLKKIGLDGVQIQTNAIQKPTTGQHSILTSSLGKASSMSGSFSTTHKTCAMNFAPGAVKTPTASTAEFALSLKSQDTKPSESGFPGATSAVELLRPPRRTYEAPTKPSTGLAGSIWAAPVMTPVSTAATTLPDATSEFLNAKEDATVTVESGGAKFSLLAEYRPIKIVQGGSSSNGVLRIIKYYNEKDICVQIKADGLKITTEPLIGCATFGISESTVEFRTTIGNPIRQVTFLSAHEAEHFRQTWLTKTKHESQAPTKQPNPSVSAVDTEMDPTTKIETPRTPRQSCLTSELVNLYDASPPKSRSRQSPIHFCDINTEQSSGQLLDLGSPVRDLPSDRLSNDLLHDLSTLEGGQLLITFDNEDEHVATSEAISSALEDLFDLDNEPLLEGALHYLSSGPEGPFLDRILLNTADGRQPSSITLNEILGSRSALSIAEALVGEFFRRSEIFNQLALEPASMVIKRKTRKILEIAISQREKPCIKPTTANASLEAAGTLKFPMMVVPNPHLDKSSPNQVVSATERMPSLTDDLEPIEPRLSPPLQQLNEGTNFLVLATSGVVQDTNASFSTQPALKPSGGSFRVAYTKEELLRLRNNVSTLDFESLTQSSLTWKDHHQLVCLSRKTAATKPLVKAVTKSIMYSERAPASQPTERIDNTKQKYREDLPPHQMYRSESIQSVCKSNSSGDLVLVAAQQDRHDMSAPATETFYPLPLASSSHFCPPPSFQGKFPPAQRVLATNLGKISSCNPKILGNSATTVIDQQDAKDQQGLPPIDHQSNEQRGRLAFTTNGPNIDNPVNVTWSSAMTKALNSIEDNENSAHVLSAKSATSYHSRTSSLSPSAQEFIQAVDKTRIEDGLPAGSRHTAVNFEVEGLIKKYKALSLNTESKSQQAQPSPLCRNEELSTVLCLEPQQLALSPAPEFRGTVQGTTPAVPTSPIAFNTTAVAPIPVSHVTTQLSTGSSMNIRGEVGLSASRWATPGLAAAPLPIIEQSSSAGSSAGLQNRVPLIPRTRTINMQGATGIFKVDSMPAVSFGSRVTHINGPQFNNENAPLSNAQIPRGRSPGPKARNPAVPQRSRGPESPFRPSAPSFKPLTHSPRPQLSSQSFAPSPRPVPSRLYVPTNEDLQATKWFQNITRSDSDSP